MMDSGNNDYENTTTLSQKRASDKLDTSSDNNQTQIDNEKSDSPTNDHNLKRRLEATVSCLNRMIFQLGDASHRPNYARKRPYSEANDDNTSKMPPMVPPPGLEKQFQELYDALYPCLVGRHTKTNTAALVMGMRGSGKSMLVERCIHHLMTQQPPDQAKFRIVRLNGILLRGNDVTYVVQEIVKQLSQLAMRETSVQDDKELSKLLRLRLNSTFTSNLSLLDDVLKLACVDGIPILIVLDELDRFMGKSSSAIELSNNNAPKEASASERQLLLYHLLDRVTTQGSSLSLICMTVHLSTVGLLEKRVKSRAEGASKVIYVKPYTTYERTVDMILKNVEQVEWNGSLDYNDGHESDEQGKVWTQLYGSLSRLLRPSTAPTTDEGDTIHQIHAALERNFRLGKDLRWFGRVVSCALSLLHGDCQTELSSLNYQKKEKFDLSDLPRLQAEHIWTSLAANGASLAHCDAPADEQSSSRPDLSTVGGHVGGVAINPRVQVLMDLSGPQVALVLAARRILARDGLKEMDPKPLTFDRMMNEYQSSYRGSSDKYSARILREAFGQLMDQSLLRPSADHSGGGPLQYEYRQTYQDMYALNLSRVPLHFPLDINRELGEAIKLGFLSCSTALREWGKQRN